MKLDDVLTQITELFPNSFKLYNITLSQSLDLHGDKSNFFDFEVMYRFKNESSELWKLRAKERDGCLDLKRLLIDINTYISTKKAEYSSESLEVNIVKPNKS